MVLLSGSIGEGLPTTGWEVMLCCCTASDLLRFFHLKEKAGKYDGENSSPETFRAILLFDVAE